MSGRIHTRSILNSGAAAFAGLDEDQKLDAAALKIGSELGNQKKLVDHVDLNYDDLAVIFRVKGSDEQALLTALGELGVKRSESYIPGMPGRMWYGKGADKVEVRVAPWQTAYPA